MADFRNERIASKAGEQSHNGGDERHQQESRHHIGALELKMLHFITDNAPILSKEMLHQFLEVLVSQIMRNENPVAVIDSMASSLQTEPIILAEINTILSAKQNSLQKKTKQGFEQGLNEAAPLEKSEATADVVGLHSKEPADHRESQAQPSTNDDQAVEKSGKNKAKVVIHLQKTTAADSQTDVNAADATVGPSRRVAADSSKEKNNSHNPNVPSLANLSEKAPENSENPPFLSYYSLADTCPNLNPNAPKYKPLSNSIPNNAKNTPYVLSVDQVNNSSMSNPIIPNNQTLNPQTHNPYPNPNPSSSKLANDFPNLPQTKKPQTTNDNNPNLPPKYKPLLSNPWQDKQRPLRSFIDVVEGRKDDSPTIPFKPVTTYKGQPAIIFTKGETEIMAAPFKLSLIGKFSYGRPSMAVIRTYVAKLGLKGDTQVSLLDNRHVVIRFQLEENYTRLWVRQTWHVQGFTMRLFKWSPDFRCNEESPIVPVWISLPFLPMHLINCKNALMSIAAAVGKPLRFDQATAILNRPNVARVLVECDVSMPLLKNIRIVDGDKEFIQDIVYENIPKYCYTCKHLGHIHAECYIANPSLRELPKENRASEADKGKEKVTEKRPMPQYVPKSKILANTDILTVPSSSTTVIPTPIMSPVLPIPKITTISSDTLLQDETIAQLVATTNLQCEDIPSNFISPIRSPHSAKDASTDDDLGSETNDRLIEDDFPLITLRTKARRKRKGQRKYH